MLLHANWLKITVLLFSAIFAYGYIGITTKWKVSINALYILRAFELKRNREYARNLRDLNLMETQE